LLDIRLFIVSFKGLPVGDRICLVSAENILASDDALKFIATRYSFVKDDEHTGMATFREKVGL